MRLTSAQQEAIVDAFRKAFRSEARLLLFGSRTDDARRGGDIDLCVETNTDRAWDALVDLRRSSRSNFSDAWETAASTS